MDGRSPSIVTVNASGEYPRSRVLVGVRNAEDVHPVGRVGLGE